MTAAEALTPISIVSARDPWAKRRVWGAQRTSADLVSVHTQLVDTEGTPAGGTPLSLPRAFSTGVGYRYVIAAFMPTGQSWRVRQRTNHAEHSIRRASSLPGAQIIVVLDLDPVLGEQ